MDLFIPVEYIRNNWCGKIPQRTEDAPLNDQLKTQSIEQDSDAQGKI